MDQGRSEGRNRSHVVEGEENGVRVAGGDTTETLEDGEPLAIEMVQGDSHLRPRGEVGQRPGVHHPTAIDDDDVVAHLLDLAEEVGVEQHGGAAIAEFSDQVPHLAAADWVESRGGLVEDYQCRSAEDRGRQAQTLLHPFGVPGHSVITSSCEPDQAQRFGDGLGAFATWNTDESGVGEKDLTAIEPVRVSE
jgi:hypothetical protein